MSSTRQHTVKVSYDAVKGEVAVTSPKTGKTLVLWLRTAWDGEMAEELVKKVKRACVDASSQFGKSFVSGGTTLEMTSEELLTWRDAYCTMVDHFNCWNGE